MDSIFISNLEVQTHIGITEQERATTQKVRISVELLTDVSTAGSSDDINDTINYDAVADRIQHVCRLERNTVEKLATDIAETLLQNFQPHQVKVSVWKFVIPNTDGVAITITRP